MKNHRKKIGILGGNFNPVHFGHLMIADQAVQRLQLEKVYLMPEYLPPHINEKRTIEADHRLAMLKLAIADNPRLAIEPLEISREGRSYTYDSLSILTKKHPEVDYTFIIGSDMVDYLSTWYQVDKLLELVTFAAVRRTSKMSESQYPVEWLDLPILDISSTEIRKMIAEGIEPEYLIPKTVLNYIKENDLYKK